MADFCTKCHKYYGMKGKPDIDVDAILLKLQDGEFLPVGICEGCRLVAVAKIGDSLKVQYVNSSWVDYDRKPVGAKEAKEESENG